MFVHVVLFWATPDASADAKRQLAGEAVSLLSRVPTVRGLWTGRPAGTPREVVDNSYELGLTVLFDDQAGHDAYQEHPLHLEFIARNKAAWNRVRVYDFS